MFEWKRKALGAIILGITAAALLFSVSPAQARECLYVAHKGNVGSVYTENSLEAFQYASKQPALYGIETDIWKTERGDYICYHEREDGKVVWGGRDVATLSLTGIKSATEGNRSCHIATLKEYLGACKVGGKWAFIQLQQTEKSKQRAYIDDLLRIVNDEGMLGQCFFTGSATKAEALGLVKTRAKALYNKDVKTSLGSGSSTTISSLDTAIANAKKYHLDSIAVYAKSNMDAKFRSAMEKLEGTGIMLRGSGEGTGANTEEKARSYILNYNLHSVYTTGFIPAAYTVKFTGNTGDTISSSTVRWGASVAPPAAAAVAKYTKPGYTFKGWNTTAYKDVRSNLTVNATYNLNTYSVQYKCDGADASKLPATRKFTVETPAFAVAACHVKKTGQTFAGWYTQKTGGSKVSKIERGTHRNCVLHARFRANTYKIVFHANYGTTDKQSSQTMTYGKNITLKANPFSRNGYTFKGWSTAKNSTAIKYTNRAPITKALTIIDKATVNLYAVWKKK